MNEDPGGGLRVFGSRFESLSGDTSDGYTEVTGNNGKPKPNKRKDQRDTLKETMYLKQTRMDQHNGPRFLVLQRTDPGKTMEGENPFFIKKAMDAITTNVKITRLRDGGLLLKTVDRQQANKLLKQTTFGGTMNIKITEHAKLNLCSGTVYCRDLIKVDDKTILDELKKQHVVKMDRMKKRNEKGQLIDSGVFIFTFDLSHIPDSIDVGFYPCKVKQYVPSPLRCINCLRFGHTKKWCKGNRICADCGNLYHDNTKCQIPVTCVNCRGHHSALDRKCPLFLDEMEIQKISVTERLSLNEARKKRRQQVPEAPVFTRSFAEVAGRSRSAADQTGRSTSHNSEPTLAESNNNSPRTSTKKNTNGSPTPNNNTSQTTSTKTTMNRSPILNKDAIWNSTLPVDNQQPSCSSLLNDADALFSTPQSSPTHSMMDQGKQTQPIALDLTQHNHDTMDYTLDIEVENYLSNDTNAQHCVPQVSTESENLLSISQAISDSIHLPEDDQDL